MAKQVEPGVSGECVTASGSLPDHTYLGSRPNCLRCHAVRTREELVTLITDDVALQIRELLSEGPLSAEEIHQQLPQRISPLVLGVVLDRMVRQDRVTVKYNLEEKK